MEQKSQVWISWPGGIGWPTPIPLKGGKRRGKATRKVRKSSKSRKASRKGRKGSTRRR